jgi:hypothetical protein
VLLLGAEEPLTDAAQVLVAGKHSCGLHQGMPALVACLGISAAAMQCCCWVQKGRFTYVAQMPVTDRQSCGLHHGMYALVACLGISAGTILMLLLCADRPFTAAFQMPVAGRHSCGLHHGMPELVACLGISAAAMQCCCCVQTGPSLLLSRCQYLAGTAVVCITACLNW